MATFPIIVTDVSPITHESTKIYVIGVPGETYDLDIGRLTRGKLDKSSKPIDIVFQGGTFVTEGGSHDGMIVVGSDTVLQGPKFSARNVHVDPDGTLDGKVRITASDGLLHNDGHLTQAPELQERGRTGKGTEGGPAPTKDYGRVVNPDALNGDFPVVFERVTDSGDKTLFVIGKPATTYKGLDITAYTGTEGEGYPGKIAFIGGRYEDINPQTAKYEVPPGLRNEYLTEWTLVRGDEVGVGSGTTVVARVEAVNGAKVGWKGMVSEVTVENGNFHNNGRVFDESTTVGNYTGIGKVNNTNTAGIPGFETDSVFRNDYGPVSVRTDGIVKETAPGVSMVNDHGVDITITDAQFAEVRAAGVVLMGKQADDPTVWPKPAEPEPFSMKLHQDGRELQVKVTGGTLHVGSVTDGGELVQVENVMRIQTGR